MLLQTKCMTKTVIGIGKKRTARDASPPIIARVNSVTVFSDHAQKEHKCKYKDRRKTFAFHISIDYMYEYFDKHGCDFS